jgi:hypothetical protein
MFANRFWSAQRKARQGARRRGSASEAGDCCLLRTLAGRKAEAGGYTRVQGSHIASSISLPAMDRSLSCPISPAFHLENETENTPRTRVPDPRLRRPAMPTARRRPPPLRNSCIAPARLTRWLKPELGLEKTSQRTALLPRVVAA